ncbi:MAG: hypothetical protein HAW67_02620 [Endozoicomonadaceae bacterium]|nr:hypothetical protein [Endozoicomonadaceae bacterium]
MKVLETINALPSVRVSMQDVTGEALISLNDARTAYNNLPISINANEECRSIIEIQNSLHASTFWMYQVKSEIVFQSEDMIVIKSILVLVTKNGAEPIFSRLGSATKGLSQSGSLLVEALTNSKSRLFSALDMPTNRLITQPSVEIEEVEDKSKIEHVADNQNNSLPTRKKQQASQKTIVRAKVEEILKESGLTLKEFLVKNNLSNKDKNIDDASEEFLEEIIEMNKFLDKQMDFIDDDK